VGVGDLGHQGGDVDRRLGERAEHRAHRLRRDGRKVALKIDHGVTAPLRVEPLDRLEDPVRAGSVVGPGQHCLAAGRAHGLGDLFLRAGDGHRPHVRGHRPAPDVYDHGLAVDLGQRLAGQPRCREARGNDHDRGAGQSHGGRVEMAGGKASQDSRAGGG
jgi:hypothetical protein